MGRGTTTMSTSTTYAKNAGRDKSSRTREISDEKLIDFLLDSGQLFHLNLTFWNTMGQALVVVKGDRGTRKLVLIDSTTNPTITFDPESYRTSQKKWLTWWNKYGLPAHQLRQRILGYVVQKA